MNTFFTFTKTKLKAFIVCFLLMSAAPALEWAGECVTVHDGDTIVVMYHELPLKVRLYGIDAPERGQDFSRRSRQHLADLVLHKTVRVDFMGFDRYNRVVGLVRVNDRCVHREMLGAGLAWVYPKYCAYPHLADWLPVEEQARRDAAGLWVRKRPLPPWEYRRRRSAAKTIP